MSNSASISIIIPCRNEEKFIGECLDSLVANEFPDDKLEVLVVDGMSDDNTKCIIKKYSEKYPFIKLIENPKKVTPVAMNKGINEAVGDYIMILSSHSKVDNNFINNNVDSLSKFDADCVGGVMITLPGSDTILSKSIALAVSHPFGVGNSQFRIGAKEPKYVDTVAFGCYRNEVFKEIGFFDENLIRNQDDEFNFRLIKNGGKVLLVPEIISYYHARDSILKLWKMYYQYGYFKPLVAKKIEAVLTWRQLIPAFFISSLITVGLLSIFIQYFLWLFCLIMSFYLFSNLVFSCSISLKKGAKCFFGLYISFFAIHFSYGLGYLKGIFDFVVFKKHEKNKIMDVPLTR